MTRRTYIYDRDMDAVVEITRSNRPSDPKRGDGLQIIRDIAPYRTVGSDIAAGGKQTMIGGRRQHREFLSRNGYVEVGNDAQGLAPPKQASWVEERRAQADRVADIKRAAGLL